MTERPVSQPRLPIMPRLLYDDGVDFEYRVVQAIRGWWVNGWVSGRFPLRWIVTDPATYRRQHGSPSPLVSALAWLLTARIVWRVLHA